MQKYFNNVTTRQGNAVAGALVTITTLEGAAAALYVDNGVTLRATPLLTDANGYFEFYAADGRYTATISGWSIATITITDILLEDPADGSTLGYDPEGIGSVPMTVEEKLHESVSVKDKDAVGDGVTSDQLAVAYAVADAYLRGVDLEWPAGTYLTTDTIPNFHLVRHTGPGIIKRGTDLFAVTTQPGSLHQNRLYISTTGSAANDGLSAAQPMASCQNAFDAIANYSLMGGRWEVVGAAGTYDFKTGQQTHSTPSKNRVVIRGPVVGASPAVPTMIIDGGGVLGAEYRHGLSASGVGVRVEFRDIKAINFSMGGGDTTRIGFLGESESDLLTTNLHADGCSWCGIYAFNTLRSRNYGGILNANRQGITCNSTQMSAGSAAVPILITNSTEVGVYWSRGSQGHLDYCVFEDNATGFKVAEDSRCDTVANNFKRNTIAIQAQTGGVYGEGGALNIFNGGTADANTTDKVYKALSGDTTELASAEQWIRFGYDRITRALAGVTPTVLSSPYTIKAYRMQGVGKSCRVLVHGIFTQATAGSTMTVNFGGLALTITVPAAAAGVAFELDAVLHEVQGGYRAFGKLQQGLNGSRMGSATATFNNAVDNVVSVAATLTNAGDSMNIYRVDVMMMG